MDDFLGRLSHFKLEKELPYIWFKLLVFVLLIPVLMYGSMSWQNWLCVFFYINYLTIVRYDFDSLDEQHDAIYGFACWIMLFIIEICSLLQVNFWFDLAISVGGVFLYYTVKALIKRTKVDIILWIKDIVSLLLLGYLASIVVGSF